MLVFLKKNSHLSDFHQNDFEYVIMSVGYDEIFNLKFNPGEFKKNMDSIIQVLTAEYKSKMILLFEFLLVEKVTQLLHLCDFFLFSKYKINEKIRY